VIVLAIAEQMGLSRSAIGLVFLFATVALYAGIGIMSRTNDAAEYYVAGRRVPAVYNGMATGADWMSAASFIGMAGTLYLTGYGGLAFIMGWTGGYCLVALFLAPYLRKFGQFTIPDFLGARYEGNLPRFIGILAAILCSFTYVVAQIYGVGLITTRLSGLAFEIGIFVGLGGILVCSFLGGMRAVTWTQVAQYIILIVAYMIPVVWLSVKQTGVPIPQAVYGYQLEKVTAREQQLIDDPKEKEVIAIFKKQSDDLAAKLKDVPASLAADKAAAEKKVEDLKAANAPVAELQAAEKALAGLPKDEAAAKDAWTKAKAAADGRAKPLAGMPAMRRSTRVTPMATPRPEDLQRIAAQLPGPGVLPDGGHGRAAAHPDALLHHAVGEGRTRFGDLVAVLHLPAVLHGAGPGGAGEVRGLQRAGGHTVRQAAIVDQFVDTVDPTLLSVADVNKDGIFQLGEMRIGGDIIVLATPEIGGLPYVISGLVAAGGLAAALSTADGLLLTIANALSHDLYYKMIDPNAPTARRVMISKALLLVVALARLTWRRRNRRTSCSWSRRRSRSRRRPSSRR
jgi:cation/acetate symporter